MKKFVLLVNALAVMARLENGLSVEGSLFKDKESGVLTFRPYNRLSRVPGYIPPTVVLYETPNGSLRQTAKRNKIVVSVKRSLGHIRSASEIMAQARELTDFLKKMAKKPTSINQ